MKDLIEEIKSDTLQSFIDLINYSARMKDGISDGILYEFINKWGIEEVKATVDQAQRLVNEYNSEGKDIDELIRSNYPYNEMEIRQKERHNTEGLIKLSEDLLELFCISGEYKQFPFDSFERIVEEYKEKILDNGTVYPERINQALSKEMCDLLAYVFNNDKNGFEFDKKGLLCLSGLLTIINTLNSISSTFIYYDQNRDDCINTMREFCFNYYNNTLAGHPIREFSLNMKEVPSSFMREGTKSIIKNTMAWTPAGITGLVVIISQNIKTDDFENALGSGVVAGFFALIAGWIGGLIVCKLKDCKAEKNSEAVKEENKKEQERWKAEVNEYFNSKATDLKFLSSEAKSYADAVSLAAGRLAAYISLVFDFIPGKYRWDIDAVRSFYNYINDGRADNIKEAVNMYVTEKETLEFRRRQIQAQREIAAAQEKLAKEAALQNNLYQRKLAEQREHSEAVIEGLRKLNREIERSNKIDEKRNELISELKDDTSALKNELHKLN